jgi:hypothetical protein
MAPNYDWGVQGGHAMGPSVQSFSCTSFQCSRSGNRIWRSKTDFSGTGTIFCVQRKDRNGDMCRSLSCTMVLSLGSGVRLARAVIPVGGCFHMRDTSSSCLHERVYVLDLRSISERAISSNLKEFFLLPVFCSLIEVTRERIST